VEDARLARTLGDNTQNTPATDKGDTHMVPVVRAGRIVTIITMLGSVS
jgi:hypothetical protein